MRIYLQTERLILRQFTPDDVDNLVDLDADPAVMHYITGGRPTPRAEIRDDILPAFLRYYERDARFGFWAAIDKPSGVFLGWFHFRPREGDDPDTVELGYRLRRSAWGQGYATEGSRALIHKGFTELGVRRVFAETMVVNLASRRVLEKAGLRLVRVFHQAWPDPIEGDEEGDVEYALLKDDIDGQIKNENRRAILTLGRPPNSLKYYLTDYSTLGSVTKMMAQRCRTRQSYEAVRRRRCCCSRLSRAFSMCWRAIVSACSACPARMASSRSPCSRKDSATRSGRASVDGPRRRTDSWSRATNSLSRWLFAASHSAV